ncbi:MAG: uracil-DNA glycosylase [Victivallales bacterium]|jgi:DNA polymerase
MHKQTLINQIIECLEIESENYAYADVSPAVLQKFMKLKKTEPAKFAKPEPKRDAEPIRTAPTSAPAANIAKSKVEVGSASVENALKPSERPELDKMQLDELAATAAECTLCGLHKTRTKSVFGDGNRNAELMFIGEGPGKDEDEQGIPFVGRAGQLLTSMIIGMQFTREEVYIANIVKCRPPENRNPTDEEAEKCLPYLNRQIDIIRPKVIVLLGAVPLKYLLGLNGITKIRGTWYEYRGIKVMPTLHPAYLLRNPSAKREAWEDLKKVMKFFGKKPAPREKKETVNQ